MCCFLDDEKARSFLAPCIAPLGHTGHTMTSTHEVSHAPRPGLPCVSSSAAAQSRSGQHPVQAGGRSVRAAFQFHGPAGAITRPRCRSWSAAPRRARPSPSTACGGDPFGTIREAISTVSSTRGSSTSTSLTPAAPRALQPLPPAGGRQRPARKPGHAVTQALRYAIVCACLCTRRTGASC